MAKTLHHIEIHPGKNGGHRVMSHYQAAPKKSGNMGMYMEHSEPEEHMFGAGEDGAMMAHVGKALGMKGKISEPDCE